MFLNKSRRLFIFEKMLGHHHIAHYFCEGRGHADNDTIVRITKNPFFGSGQRTRDPKNSRRESGFTLMELIVVVSLLGIMLVFAIPRLQNNPFLYEGKKSARWMIAKIQALKEKAIRDQKQYILHIDLDTGRLWESDQSMSQDDLDNAAMNGNDLPGDVRIVDVEYPDQGKVYSGRADITFYKAGYTDKAIIHMQDEEDYISFVIEPFLAKVKMYQKYASFED